MTKHDHVKYSPTEQKIFDILKGGKKMTISQIAERVYRNRKHPPFYHRETIYKLVHRFGEKAYANREPLTLYKDGAIGPYESMYWME